MTSNKLENNSLFGYKKLIAWQKANELAHKVYDLTIYLLEFAHERKFIKERDFQDVCLLRAETGHIIWKLYLSQK